MERVAGRTIVYVVPWSTVMWIILRCVIIPGLPSDSVEIQKALEFTAGKIILDMKNDKEKNEQHGKNGE